MIRLARGLGAAGCAALCACAGPGVPDAELDPALIAIHYRTETEARRRAEALQDPAPVGATAGAVAGHKLGLRTHLGELGRFFSEAWGAQRPDLREGRLALLDPRSRELSFVEGARRGAVPLAWSADRSRLLFSQPAAGEGDLQIFEWDRASGSLHPLTRGPALHPQACYAADGRIAVTRVEGRGEDQRLRVLSRGPGGRRSWHVLGAGPADHSPACSPGQPDVAFVREAPGRPSEIWLARPGSPARRLGVGAQPRFGAGGDWLYYAALRAGQPQLFRVRADGRSRASLGRTGLGGAWPAPSPDGAHVVYVAAEEPPRRHLYVRRFDGSGDRILFADGDAEFPVW